MEKGLFITFEGPDGSGKTTQIDLLGKFLKEEGHSVLLTREPGGTPIGEKIREIILDCRNTEMDNMAEALLYAASRAQHVAQVILPSLKKGTSVICDRFVDSSIAYQGWGRGLGEPVRIINHIAAGNCKPDITFLLCIDPQIGMKRIVGQMDRLEMERMEFHKAVLQGYLNQARQEPERIVVVDGKQEVCAIEAEVRQRVTRLLAKRRG